MAARIERIAQRGFVMANHAVGPWIHFYHHPNDMFWCHGIYWKYPGTPLSQEISERLIFLSGVVSPSTQRSRRLRLVRALCARPKMSRRLWYFLTWRSTSSNMVYDGKEEMVHIHKLGDGLLLIIQLVLAGIFNPISSAPRWHTRAHQRVWPNILHWGRPTSVCWRLERIAKKFCFSSAR